eukprot:scaffold42707_cov60-Phaeocystis_antarctica.AAC.2
MLIAHAIAISCGALFGLAGRCVAAVLMLAPVRADDEMGGGVSGAACRCKQRSFVRTGLRDLRLAV